MFIYDIKRETAVEWFNIDNHLINTKYVKKLYENKIIHKYVESMNTLDYHIYYLNKEMDKLISNKKCGV